MVTRIGKVTKVYPEEGRVKVTFEDSGSSSLPLAVLTMNKEYSMPSIGDRVVTIHMENGSSKGFVLGTYYGGGIHPKTSSGYRKDFTSGCYATCKGGEYTLKGSDIIIKCSYGTITVEDIMKRLERIEDKLGLPHTI